ncbi:NUDIX domain-containing protein [Paenibacillus sp. FJAT-26967]|uniref:NUDIX domain-containing protein n=1 Tax=Paenibacillus sp. FJAT-26967 TaxID=1729690 RepID=UPI0008382E5B|nr:NUDIX domain-containing protein [Paenibacillus sp. FJAT-26967]
MSRHTSYADWNGQRVKLTWTASRQIPDHAKVTSVHGVCYHNDKILLVHVHKRGFNLPGGHVEGSETPEEAFHREAMEEGCVRGRIGLIGSIEVSHEENEHFSPDGKYPMIGYQLFYRMEITECLPFTRAYECLSRIWVEPEEIPYVIEDHGVIPIIVQEACRDRSSGQLL